MGDNSAMAMAFEEALKSGDFRQMGQMLQKFASDDFVEEWPQSGERLTKAASLRLAEHYPEMSGTSVGPTGAMTPHASARRTSRVATAARATKTSG